MKYLVERVYDAIEDTERYYVVFDDGGRFVAEYNTLAGPYNSVDAAFVIARRIQANNGAQRSTLYDPDTGEMVRDTK